MPTGSDLISWLTGHAGALLAVSVTVGARRAGPRGAAPADRRHRVDGLAAGAHYLVAAP